MDRFSPGRHCRAIQPYNVDNFTHDKGDKSFTIEMSSLAAWRPGYFTFDQLYHDAIDEGVALYNPKTGKTTTWFLSKIDYDREGDLRFWLLLPTEATVKEFPVLIGYTLTVFND